MLDGFYSDKVSDGFVFNPRKNPSLSERCLPLVDIFGFRLCNVAYLTIVPSNAAAAKAWSRQ